MWLNILLISIFGCSGILTTSFDLGGLISGNRMAGVPLGRSLGNGEVDIEGVCTKTGLACQNCTHAVTCILLPVGWLKVPLQECPKDHTCNARDGGCSKIPTPECDVVSQKYQHVCEQVGIFPDAFDCRKFHLCSPPDGFPSGSPADHRVALCPRNYGYNPSTAQCSIKLLNGQCSETPVPKCKIVGDYGVLPSSPNHYYVCLSKRGVHVPQIFVCPHGWFFVEGFCRPEPQAPEKSTPTTPPTTTEAITETSTLEASTTEKFSITKALFATEKPSTEKPDNFLADIYGPFNFNNYEGPSEPEEWSPNDDETLNSWEQ